MSKNRLIFGLILAFSLAISGTAAVAGEGDESACAPWTTSVNVDAKYLEKLEKKVAKEKPKEGVGYSQNKLTLLMGKDPDAAKSALEDDRDTIEKTKDGLVNLGSADLSGFDLSGMNLDKVNLYKANLTGANLSGASLRGSNLSKAKMDGANLNGADLSFSDLSSASMEGASLCGAKVMSSNLEDSEMVGAYMKGARLDRAKNVPKAFYLYSSGILHDGLIVPEIE
jgi:hypothetical protein